jgi:hypothetical protein
MNCESVSGTKYYAATDVRFDCVRHSTSFDVKIQCDQKNITSGVRNEWDQWDQDTTLLKAINQADRKLSTIKEFPIGSSEIKYRLNEL